MILMITIPIFPILNLKMNKPLSEGRRQDDEIEVLPDETMATQATLPVVAIQEEVRRHELLPQGVMEMMMVMGYQTVPMRVEGHPKVVMVHRTVMAVQKRLLTRVTMTHRTILLSR